MKKILSGLLLISPLTNLSGQQTDMEQLKNLNATFIHNFVTNDTASHNRILHKDFICITGEGHTIRRNEYLDEWANGFEGFIYWDYRDEDIKIFGTTALVHAQNKYVVVREGKEITGMSMYTDVYVKENGQWVCVQAQLCKVASQNFAGEETIVRKYDFRK